MRVEAIAVGQLQPVLDVRNSGQSAAVPAHGAVHVQPEALLAADARRSRAADRSALDEVVPTVARHEARLQPGLAVLRDLLRQRVGAHGEALVHLDQPQVLPPEPGDLDRLLDRRMRLGGGVGHQPPVAAALVGLA